MIHDCVVIYRYRSMFHKRDEGNEINPQRIDLLRKAHLMMEKDGLNSLTYKVLTFSSGFYTLVQQLVKKAWVFLLHCWLVCCYVAESKRPEASDLTFGHCQLFLHEQKFLLKNKC